MPLGKPEMHGEQQDRERKQKRKENQLREHPESETREFERRGHYQDVHENDLRSSRKKGNTFFGISSPKYGLRQNNGNMTRMAEPVPKNIEM